MKGNPKVVAALQEAVNMEASLAAAYYLNGKHLKCGLGLKTGKELMDLGKQSCCHKDKLIKRLLFLEANAEIDAEVATIGSGVGNILKDLLQLENDVLARYTASAQICWEADDMSNFHLFQHLCKWHTTGGNGFDGHIRYIEHEQLQLNTLGEVNYLTAHI
jgi:bacterioferritin (cytochrome b1)